VSNSERLQGTDPVAALTALLTHLDADIAAGRLSRADAIEVAEHVDDQLHALLVDCAMDVVDGEPVYAVALRFRVRRALEGKDGS
jgi:hypothetical protein